MSNLQRALKSFELPNPDKAHFADPDKAIYDPARVHEFFTPNYRAIMTEAQKWAKTHQILPKRKENVASAVGFAIIDMQRTFCLKQGELTLEPASIGDAQRISEFVYRNLRVLTNIVATLDTHFLFQIFHPAFWLDADGNFVPDFTAIFPDDIRTGKYSVNPEMAHVLFGDMRYLGWLKEYVLKYTETLLARGKPPLVIWPVHGVLGSPGHALVPAVQTACQFHEIARYARTTYRLKGDKPLTEHYSPFGTEVVEVEIGGQRMTVGEQSDQVIDDLLKNRILIGAGEASSHCVGSGLYDILHRVQQQDPKLAKRIYILEDCTSPVPGFEDQANKAFDAFRAAGMHLVKSTTPMDEWPDIPQDIFAKVA